MSAGYTGIGWNRHKRVYDVVMFSLIAMYLVVFIGVSALIHRGPHSMSFPIVLVRALGTCAILLLHIVLLIGPLARLDPRFLPLLYNRRHLGVTTFVIGLAHSILVLVWYHGFGAVNPIISVLTNNPRYDSFVQFPFEVLGVVALLILFLMAATSHDFWLKNLSPSVWKSLHMLVYIAYALLVMHIALGALQFEKSPVYVALLLIGCITVGSVHLTAGIREFTRDLRGILPRASETGDECAWIDVASIEEIPDARAKIVCPKRGERIAVFRHGDSISAVSNVCAHQGGPLGEGRIIDGCITCPWHGYQYIPSSGQSPPPFTEKIPTYDVRIEANRILIRLPANPPGTPTHGAPVNSPAASGDATNLEVRDGPQR